MLEWYSGQSFPAETDPNEFHASSVGHLRPPLKALPYEERVCSTISQEEKALMITLWEVRIFRFGRPSVAPSRDLDVDLAPASEHVRLLGLRLVEGKFSN